VAGDRLGRIQQRLLGEPPAQPGAEVAPGTVRSEPATLAVRMETGRRVSEIGPDTLGHGGSTLSASDVSYRRDGRMSAAFRAGTLKGGATTGVSDDHRDKRAPRDHRVACEGAPETRWTRHPADVVAERSEEGGVIFGSVRRHLLTARMPRIVSGGAPPTPTLREQQLRGAPQAARPSTAITTEPSQRHS
jgi:hypothetical protein